MGLPQIVSRNSTQQIVGSTVQGRITSNVSPGIYVCPAGKRARVTGCTMRLDAVGADATYALAVNIGGTFREISAFVVANGFVSFIGEIFLDAGDFISNVGDAGSTNGTCDMTCNFIELG